MARSKQTKPVHRRSNDQVRSDGLAKLRRVIRYEKSIVDRLGGLERRLAVIRDRGSKVRTILLKAGMTDDTIRHQLAEETPIATQAAETPIATQAAE